jgi:L-amino acid N-acyltransferase YncA
MYCLRDATEADLSAIVEITNQAILYTTAVWSLTPVTIEARTAWLHERQGRGFPVIVAVDGDEVLGFASFGDFRAWEGYLHTVEHSLYVRPEAQGRGIGRALLTELVARATARGSHVMVAGIEAGNEVSIALHQRLGFEDGGCLRQVGRKFDRWLDLRFMQKRLSEA